MVVVVELTIGELASVSAVEARSKTEVRDDMWGPAVSESKRENSDFCYFLILNSAESLEICTKFLVAPKILKFCV